MLSQIFRLSFFIAVLTTTTPAFGQSSDSFFETIENDSAKLFFNSHFRYVNKSCAQFVRLVRIDSLGNFNSYFADVHKDVNRRNVVLATGRYRNGRKDGRFEVYYLNGNLMCAGSYQDNKPIGQWNFFYNNGLPERELKFTEQDTLLITFVDRTGNIAVKDGEGHFSGYVAGKFNNDSILVKGKISRGKPIGLWTSDYFKTTAFVKEIYDSGKLINGSILVPKGVSPKADFFMEYHNRSLLKTFFLGNYLGNLEKPSLAKCGAPDQILHSGLTVWDLQKALTH
jgi:hypothetical protein